MVNLASQNPHPILIIIMIIICRCLVRPDPHCQLHPLPGGSMARRWVIIIRIIMIPSPSSSSSSSSESSELLWYHYHHNHHHKNLQNHHIITMKSSSGISGFMDHINVNSYLNQSVIISRDVFAKNHLIWFCKLFTNITSILFSAQLILRVISTVIFTSKLFVWSFVYIV